MRIEKADSDDLQAVLELQYLAYQSEAELLGDWTIQPLRQTLAEVEAEFSEGIILKAVDGTGKILGSVRGRAEGGTCYIGKLFVHPNLRGRGIGLRLMAAIELACPAIRYELFTSSKSLGNMRLYKRLGYTSFKEEPASPCYGFVYLEKKTYV